jgi:hypothetical protein
MALLMDLNRGMLYVLQCLCLSLKSEATIEVETQSSSNNDRPSKDILITRRVPQGAEQVCSETKHNERSKQWVKNLWVFFLLLVWKVFG